MRIALQISTSALGIRFKVDREGEKGQQDDQLRNIIRSFEGQDLGGVHIMLSQAEAHMLSYQLRRALRL